MQDAFTEIKNKVNIKEVIEHYLSNKFKRDKIKCPFHHDNNASLSILPSNNTFKCFGCETSGSVIDFVMKYKSVDKFEAVKLLNADFNLGIIFKEKKPTKQLNIKEYITKCEQDIDKTDYFIKRGLSNETIKKHRLGYDIEKKQVIIPYSSKLRYYQSRSVIDKKFFKPPTDIAGTEPIYNENILYNYNNENPIFIVESPICAMSIEQYGSSAIATCGGNAINKLTELFKNKKVKNSLSFILSFDNDDAGVKFTKELSDYFKKEKVKFITYNIAGKYKDPNDCLQHNNTELVKNIIKAKEMFYKQQTSYGDLKSVKEIMNMKFANTSWYIHKLFTNGVNLLCGASKSGKSWFVQQLCLAIASGDEFLDAGSTRAECWYMAMEDDEELSQVRLKKMLQGGNVPDGFYISYEIYPMDKISNDRPTLTEYLEANLRRNPKIKIIVIDTFQKIRSSALYGEGMFAHDYRDISTFKQLAEKYKVCIIIVHHLNKMRDKDADGDPFSKINGTNGLMASADCIFLLNRKRGEDTATLTFTGRKIGEDSWSIRQNQTNMKWQKIGTAEEEKVKREKEEYDKDEYVNTIRSLLRNNTGSWTGTCTKLLEECSKLYNHLPARNINHIGQYLNSITDKLKQYDGIMHISPSKNGGKQGRPHTFYYTQTQQQKLNIC